MVQKEGRTLEKGAVLSLCTLEWDKKGYFLRIKWVEFIDRKCYDSLIVRKIFETTQIAFVVVTQKRCQNANGGKSCIELLSEKL